MHINRWWDEAGIDGCNSFRILVDGGRVPLPGMVNKPHHANYPIDCGRPKKERTGTADASGHSRWSDIWRYCLVTVTELLKLTPDESQPCTVILWVPTLTGRKAFTELAVVLYFSTPSR